MGYELERRWMGAIITYNLLGPISCSLPRACDENQAKFLNSRYSSQDLNHGDSQVRSNGAAYP